MNSAFIIAVVARALQAGYDARMEAANGDMYTEPVDPKFSLPPRDGENSTLHNVPGFMVDFGVAEMENVCPSELQEEAFRTGWSEASSVLFEKWDWDEDEYSF